VTTGQSSTLHSAAQHHDKNFTILYVVFEKIANCNDYPPDQIVTFKDVQVFCNGKRTYPTWRTSWVDNVCDMRAHIVDKETITITWTTSADKNPKKELFALNNNTRRGLRRPTRNNKQN